MPVPNSSIPKFLRGLLFVLVASAAYLYPFPQANVIYPVVVALHTLAGIVAAIVGTVLFWRLLRGGSTVWKVGWILLAAGAVIGLVLIYTGTSHSEFRWLYAHIGLSMLGIACLLAEMLGRAGWLRGTRGRGSLLRREF